MSPLIPKKAGPDYVGPGSRLLLLLALGVRLIAVLMSSLRMLLGGGRMLLTLGMVALAVVFRSGPVCLGRVLVVLGGFVVFVSSHGRFLRRFAPSARSRRAKVNGSYNRSIQLKYF